MKIGTIQLNKKAANSAKHAELAAGFRFICTCGCRNHSTRCSRVRCTHVPELHTWYLPRGHRFRQRFRRDLSRENETISRPDTIVWEKMEQSRERVRSFARKRDDFENQRDRLREMGQ